MAVGAHESDMDNVTAGLGLGLVSTAMTLLAYRAIWNVSFLYLLHLELTKKWSIC
jgi:hypothetical protein